MRLRTLLAATSVVLGTATALAGIATPAAAGTTHVMANWEMNEPPGAHSMIDYSGNGLTGRIGREVGLDTRVGDGTGYRFAKLTPDTPPTHPQHVVTVADSNLLDPGNRDYTVMLRLRTTYHFGNVVQKGQATVPGGNWKIQIPNGVVQCLFRGSAGQVIVSSPRRYNDGRWHTIACERQESDIVLRVDGDTVARHAGRTGRIDNDWPLSIGGKTDCDQEEVGCDYFAGDLDWVEIDADE